MIQLAVALLLSGVGVWCAVYVALFQAPGSDEAIIVASIGVLLACAGVAAAFA